MTEQGNELKAEQPSCKPFHPKGIISAVTCMEGENSRDPWIYLHAVLDTSKAAVKSISQTSSAFAAGGINLCHLD